MESDTARLARLDGDVRQMRTELQAHATLCDARWKVAWKLSAAIGALFALMISVGVTVLVR